MRLISNWGAVLRYAHTVRLGIFIALLNGVYVTISIVTSAFPCPPLWLAIANGVLAALVPLLRLVPQPKISGDTNADQ